MFENTCQGSALKWNKMVPMVPGAAERQQSRRMRELCSHVSTSGKTGTEDTESMAKTGEKSCLFFGVIFLRCSKSIFKRGSIRLLWPPRLFVAFYVVDRSACTAPACNEAADACQRSSWIRTVKIMAADCSLQCHACQHPPQSRRRADSFQYERPCRFLKAFAVRFWTEPSSACTCLWLLALSWIFHKFSQYR